MKPTPRGKASATRHSGSPRRGPRAARRGLAILSAILGSLLPPALPRADEERPAGCETGSTLEAYGLGTAWDELARMAQDTGAAPLRPDLIRRPADRATPLCADGPAPPLGRLAAPGASPTLEILPASLFASGNAIYPSGFNDGALWQGRGISAQLAAGAAFRRGAVSAAIAPTLAWQQNAYFPIVPNGRTGDLAFMNPWYGSALDLPQRFGDGPFWTASPGQSYLRLDHSGLAAAISTENMWWGPGQRNSILMSNTAAGFPHVMIGTGRQVDVGVGKAEAQLYMGRLDRSRYFTDRSHAWFYGLVVDYEPRWVPGLYLGLAGVNLKTCACLRSSSDTNSLFGAYGRWVFPPVGFEVYAEWVREDYASNLGDFLRQLDHSAGYTLGLQKVWTAGGRWVRLVLEATDTEPSEPPQLYRLPTAYYTHENNLSYTNGGQLIGAGAGAGASSQFLALDVLTSSGWYGGYLERVRRNHFVFLYMIGTPPNGDDTELTLGLRHLRSLGTLDLGVKLAASIRYSRDFLVTEGNVYAAVEVTWWPPGRE